MTWRHNPPTGARKTWKIRSRCSGATGMSEPAFGDADGVARADREGKVDLAEVELGPDSAADLDGLFIGARSEAASDGDGGLGRHVGDGGVLAGRRDLAEDEERPVGLDLDRHMGLADVAVAK